MTNTGTYVCNASTTSLLKQSSAFINVIEKNSEYASLTSKSPSINKYRDPLKWRLQIRAHPTPEFLWRKGGKVLLNSSASTSPGEESRYILQKRDFRRGEIVAKILSPSAADIGNHTIDAMLDGRVIDSVTLAFPLDVIEKPAWKIWEQPFERRIDRQVENNLTLRCLSYGSPPPTIVWYKDDVELKADRTNMKIMDQELFFPYLLVRDSGEYKCLVENFAGRLNATTYLSVTSPKTHIKHKTMVILVSLSVCGLVAGIIFFCVTIYEKKKWAYALRLEDHRTFVEGSPENLNPNISLDQQADLLPYDTKFEVPRNSIIFDHLLGSGAFGYVYRATAANLRPGKPHTTVAVKMVKSLADSAQLKALRSELKILVHIGRHMNIVNLLGACSKDFAMKGELLLIVEYCKHGNILDYMRQHRRQFVHQISEHDNTDSPLTENRTRQCTGFGSRVTTSNSLNNDHSDDRSSDENRIGSSNIYLRSITSETNFSSKTLLLWAFQIAKGMEYLAFKKVLHGDLAARNILLADDNVAKISDFGLAKDIYRKENYRKKCKDQMPVKWLAIECLRDGVFSTQSDIWSFGVVLWEIFSLGQVPYAGMKFDENFIAKLEDGIRMDRPRYANFDIYCTMRDCWAGNPLDRPSFSDLETRLGAMIGEAQRQYFLELNQPYQSDQTESAFLSRLQSPDYSAKVHEGRPHAQHSAVDTRRLQKPEGTHDSSGTCLSMAASTPDRRRPVGFGAGASSCITQWDSNADGQEEPDYVPIGSQDSIDHVSLHPKDTGQGLEMTKHDGGRNAQSAM
ncbi:vascular endothelial growth factor receptor kdr-like isoform X2 [Penaeus japonicus]|uniref:vascular endothelial growth factor receptor kdr-like isoform X2 n=1 Tax=Penaeus japonicus TaxID=27405 RepID=UPI001C714A2C|nr:vascular endothelial growth factor receptor kdr-like isoform X2 [Penaeus japonicus]